MHRNDQMFEDLTEEVSEFGWQLHFLPDDTTPAYIIGDGPAQVAEFNTLQEVDAFLVGYRLGLKMQQ